LKIILLDRDSANIKLFRLTSGRLALLLFGEDLYMQIDSRKELIILYEYYVRCYCGHYLFYDGRLFISLDDFHRRSISCPICRKNLAECLPDDFVKPDRNMDSDK